MLDDDLWRSAEPGTPSPRGRLRAVRALNDAGIPTGVMIAPIMPGLNDDHEQLDALVAACVDAGATHITPIALHLRTSRPSSPTGASVRDVFWPWLVAAHPELEGRYRKLYRRGATADADWREPVQRFVGERRDVYWRERGRPTRPAAWRGRSDDAAPGEPEAHDPEQLTLL
jgi:DNA repair photolyase